MSQLTTAPEASTLPVHHVAPGDVMEDVIAKGDLAKLTPQQRARYYFDVCVSCGLNPRTKPFEYIHLNGKLTLYPLKTTTDQLRKIHGVSLTIVSKELAGDIYTVTVDAVDKHGRHDSDIGVVALPANLRGDARANQVMKALTKAKRRATLSICGLGWIDESEVETVPGAVTHAIPAAEQAMIAQMADGVQAVDDDGECISDEEVSALARELSTIGADVRAFCNHFDVPSITELLKSQMPEVNRLTAMKRKQWEDAHAGRDL